MQPEQPFPAPWVLHGRGLILVYTLPKRWLLEQGHIPTHLETTFVGGLSALMLVDYQESNCGAYRELLFVPGQFRHGHGKHFSISRIFVSSQASLENGIANWGIPKQLAEFSWHREGNLERVQVGDFAEFVFSSVAVAAPVHLAWLPEAWRTLMHPVLAGLDLQPVPSRKILLTTLAGQGAMQPARLHLARADGVNFPNLEHLRPLMAVVAQPFRLEFPIPQLW